jgi:hypothetical protein
MSSNIPEGFFIRINELPKAKAPVQVRVTSLHLIAGGL